jgi:hypothetical protein
MVLQQLLFQPNWERIIKIDANNWERRIKIDANTFLLELNFKSIQTTASSWRQISKSS